MKKNSSALFLALLSGALVLSFPSLRAADHGDSPTASNDPSADINDVFLFLDPNDNSRVVMEMTTRGFIVPSEAVNMGIFDPKLVYRLIIEETGDVIPDARIDVTFAPRTTTSTGQIATVRMIQGANTVFQFNAP